MSTLKFSQFTELTATTATTYMVGYDGTDNIRIEASDLNTTYQLYSNPIATVGASLILEDSLSNTDIVSIIGSGSVSVSTASNVITISATDTDTTNQTLSLGASPTYTLTLTDSNGGTVSTSLAALAGGSGVASVNTLSGALTLSAGDGITITDNGTDTITVETDGTAESTHIPVKNTSGSLITKGTPVYITGNVGSSDRLQIAEADSSDIAKMPAVGLLETDLANNGEGFVVQGGYLRNITTDVIDGTSTSSNDTVYVKVGGGLTMTKPTGSTNYIQNIAKVARVGSGSSGSLIVSSILRTNDIPNLPDGQVWVGTTTYPTTTALDDIDKNYVHTQGTASATWSIVHNLGKYASVTVVDSNNMVVHGEVEYINTNEVEITFRAAFSGEAYLN